MNGTELRTERKQEVDNLIWELTLWFRMSGKCEVAHSISITATLLALLLPEFTMEKTGNLQCVNITPCRTYKV